MKWRYVHGGEIRRRRKLLGQICYGGDFASDYPFYWVLGVEGPEGFRFETVVVTAADQGESLGLTTCFQMAIEAAENDFALRQFAPASPNPRRGRARGNAWMLPSPWKINRTGTMYTWVVGDESRRDAIDAMQYVITMPPASPARRRYILWWYDGSGYYGSRRTPPVRFELLGEFKSARAAAKEAEEDWKYRGTLGALGNPRRRRPEEPVPLQGVLSILGVSWHISYDDADCFHIPDGHQVVPQYTVKDYYVDDHGPWQLYCTPTLSGAAEPELLGTVNSLKEASRIVRDDWAIRQFGGLRNPSRKKRSRSRGGPSLDEKENPRRRR